MRCYLVKDEATFERLALEKYQEEENQAALNEKQTT
jgi:hypothetical protein